MPPAPGGPPMPMPGGPPCWPCWNSESSATGTPSCSSSSTHCWARARTGKEGSAGACCDERASEPGTHLGEVGLEPLEPNLLLREPGPELLLGLLLLKDQLQVPAREVLLGRRRVDGREQVELELVRVLGDALVGTGGGLSGEQRRGRRSGPLWEAGSAASLWGRDARAGLGLEADRLLLDVELGLADDVGCGGGRTRQLDVARAAATASRTKQDARRLMVRLDEGGQRKQASALEGTG